MASSQSLKKGQYPIVCQLCEVDMKLKWKCEDCDLLMCDRCREKVHPKFKNSKEHRIVNIKDIKKVRDPSDDIGYGSELRDVKCENHTGQTCCLFCQTCEQLICPSCVTKTHKAHDLEEIREVCKLNRTRLTEEKGKLETELLQLDEIETRVEQVKNVETSRYEKTKQEICDHQTALKNEVDNYVYELLEELDGSRQSLDKSLDTEKKGVNKIRKVLQQRLTLACSALDEQDATKTLQEGNRVLKELGQTDEKPFYLETISVLKFVPSKYKMVDKYFGSLQNTVASKTTKPVFKINRQFTTRMNMVNLHWVIAFTNGFWLGQNTGKNPLVQKVLPKRDVCEVIWSFDVCVHGMALNSDDDLLLCVNESRLKLINQKTGLISDSKYDVSPLVTRAVHVTKNNQIVIAAKNIGTPFPVSGRRVIITMNEHGTQSAVYEYDRTNCRLFTYPCKVTSNTKGNIFIVDLLSNEDHGRIVVLEQDQEDPLLYVYSGCSEVNSKQLPFKPSNLVNTPSDSVIIIDSDTYYLHILNGEGHLISLFNLRNIGVTYGPYSLTINSSGLVYVGCLRDDGDDTAKLYELEYFGC